MKYAIHLGRVLVAGIALAGPAALAADGAPGKPRTPPSPESFYERSGFEGREAELGAVVMDAIRKAGPAGGEGANFNPEQVRMMGVAVSKAIKTISNDTPYQHEMNDALVKAHLTNIQFAKDHGLLDQLIEHELRTQMPMISRVGKMIREGGSLELGLIALTERTACFYQLVQEYQRNGTSIRWKAPYGNVLAVTTRLGQHDLTEKEIHEIYTMPLMKKQAEAMGLVAEFGPWQGDGWITMSVRRPEATAAASR